MLGLDAAPHTRSAHTGLHHHRSRCALHAVMHASFSFGFHRYLDTPHALALLLPHSLNFTARFFFRAFRFACQTPRIGLPVYTSCASRIYRTPSNNICSGLRSLTRASTHVLAPRIFRITLRAFRTTNKSFRRLARSSSRSANSIILYHKHRRSFHKAR